MKILHVNSLYHPNAVGGAEKSVQSLAESQIARKHSVTVVTLTEGQNRIGYVNGVKVYYIALKNLYWSFGHASISAIRKPLWHLIDAFNPIMGRTVAAILRVERPHLVHTHNLTGFSASVWWEAKRQSLPLVHTLRDYSLLCPKATMFLAGENCSSQHWACKACSLVRTRLSQRVDAVTAVSRFTLSRHLASGAFVHVPLKQVIYNSRKSKTREVHERLNTRRNSRLRIGFIGQLTPSKGIELLLTIALQLPDRDYKWLIAGAGHAEYERKLKTRFSRSNIKFLGFSPPTGFYPRIDVLVVPSLWHDPAPGVIESKRTRMAFPLLPRDGGVPEIVTDMQTGPLFEPDRPEELRSCLETLQAEPSLLNRMREHSYNSLEKFSARQTNEEFEEIYLLTARTLCLALSSVSVQKEH